MNEDAGLGRRKSKAIKNNNLQNQGGDIKANLHIFLFPASRLLIALAPV